MESSLDTGPKSVIPSEPQHNLQALRPNEAHRGFNGYYTVSVFYFRFAAQFGKTHVVKSRASHLCDTSIGSALAAIEIYNKPNFPNRESVFSILLIAAWEALFKAKILRDNGNRLQAIYFKERGRFKRSAVGVPLTIGLIEAMGRCSVAALVSDNVKALYEVRNAATHLTASSGKLPQLCFVLGAASLKNYAKLVENWFDIKLNKFSFFILPLGFNYPFTAFSPVDLEKEPQAIAALINSIAEAQKNGVSEDEAGFALVCEIRASIVTAQKLKGTPDLVVSIDPSNQNAVFIERQTDLIQSYPYGFREIAKALSAKDAAVTTNVLSEFIKTEIIKGNQKYSAYNYRTLAHQQAGPKKSTTVLYNRAFLNYAVEKLCSKAG